MVVNTRVQNLSDMMCSLAVLVLLNELCALPHLNVEIGFGEDVEQYERIDCVVCAVFAGVVLISENDFEHDDSLVRHELKQRADLAR